MFSLSICLLNVRFVSICGTCNSLHTTVNLPKHATQFFPPALSVNSQEKETNMVRGHNKIQWAGQIRSSYAQSDATIDLTHP